MTGTMRENTSRTVRDIELSGLGEIKSKNRGNCVWFAVITRSWSFRDSTVFVGTFGESVTSC